MKIFAKLTKRFYTYFSILLFLTLTLFASRLNARGVGEASILPLAVFAFGTLVYFGMFHGFLKTINGMSSDDPKERQKSFATMAGMGQTMSKFKNAEYAMKASPFEAAVKLDPKEKVNNNE